MAAGHYRLIDRTIRRGKTLLAARKARFSTVVDKWKRQLIEGAAQAFNGSSAQPEVDLTPLQAKIGQLTLVNDFLERALTKAGLLSAKR
ncbi:MAG: hypothetical protein IPO19_15235 [Rhodoferax sp.]|nr:hypothetical protein [Rhodoferax sp.]